MDIITFLLKMYFLIEAFNSLLQRGKYIYQ